MCEREVILKNGKMIYRLKHVAQTFKKYMVVLAKGKSTILIGIITSKVMCFWALV